MDPTTKQKLAALIQKGLDTKTVTPLRQALKLLESVDSSTPAPAPAAASTTTTTPLGSFAVGFGKFRHSDGPGVARKVGSWLGARG